MAKADFYLYIKAKPAANTELLCFFLTLKLYGWKPNPLLGASGKNTIVLKQNSNLLTDSTKLLETPTEYIENISDSDYASCFRNGKIVTLVLNIKVLRPLSSFNTYLTLPKQYIPSSVMFAPVMALGTGIRIGTSGEVMPCADIGAGAYIQTTISYVIK